MTSNMNSSGRWTGILNREADSSTVHIARQDLMNQVHAAHREWQAAQNYFQEVSSPDLVDVAIYSMEVAQRKYMYLVQQLRQSKGGLTDQEK